MDSPVVGEFRVKCRSHDSSLPDGNRVSAFGRDHFNAFTDAFDLWGADEDHLER
jgi:hypothetical protein